MRYHYSLIFYAFLVGLNLKAETGCMDKSEHLAKPNDPKVYHYVSCTCECTKRHKILAVRGECYQCGHVRDPKPFIIVQSPKTRKNGLNGKN